MQERTEELTRLNTELGRAKGEAEQANISKTRFLAAASHDILQPLNAARLYVTSLVERQSGGNDAQLITNIDASLDAVEEIFGALLDISRLDTGAMKPEIVRFRIDELLRQLEVEFTPLAQEKGLRLKFIPCSLAVRSDRRLLRRLLQNLVSNAVKYTPQGRVLVGCRRYKGRLRVDIYDTGLGIPASKKQAIFQEFHRLDQGAKAVAFDIFFQDRMRDFKEYRVKVPDGGAGREPAPLRPGLQRQQERCGAGGGAGRPQGADHEGGATPGHHPGCVAGRIRRRIDQAAERSAAHGLGLCQAPHAG